QIVPSAQDGRALLREERRPSRESMLGGVDGGARLIGGEGGNGADRLAGGWIGHGDSLARNGRCRFAADMGKLAEQPGIGQFVGKAGGRVFGGQAGHGGNSNGDHATISGNGERLAPNLGARRRWFCWRRAVGGEGYSEKLVLKGSCI